jgi:hypothetical protein
MSEVYYTFDGVRAWRHEAVYLDNGKIVFIIDTTDNLWNGEKDMTEFDSIDEFKEMITEYTGDHFITEEEYKVWLIS